MSAGGSEDVFGQLMNLPQTDEVWVAGAHALPMKAKFGKKEARPWLLLIQSRSRYFVLGSASTPRQPEAQELLTALVQAMFEPAQGEPGRPAAVEAGPNLPWEPVTPMLERLGVEVRQAGTLDDLNAAFQYLSVQLAGKKIPGLPIEPE
jgi:hypothetical protein